MAKTTGFRAAIAQVDNIYDGLASARAEVGDNLVESDMWNRMNHNMRLLMDLHKALNIMADIVEPVLIRMSRITALVVSDAARDALQQLNPGDNDFDGQSDVT